VQKVIARIKKKNPPPVVFIKGDEPFFRDRLLQDARSHFRSRGYEMEDLDGFSTSESEIVDTLDSVSLFGAKKFVVIRNTDKLKGKKKALCAYVADPSDSVVAMFVGKGAVATPLGKALEGGALTYESKRLSPYKGDIEKWLEQEAAASGKGLTTDLARVIHNAVGDDLHALSRALKKVVMHCDGKLISMGDLRAVLLKTAGSQVFELTNAVGARDQRKALHILDSFYRTEDEPALLLCAALLNHTERMIRAKSLLEYGLDAGDAARVLEMHPYLFKTKLVPQIKEYKLDELVDMMEHLCEVDITVKGSALNRRVVLEEFLVRFLK